MDTRFDVAVIGGGPAGCSTALALTRLGYRCLVVEKSDYSNVRVGETVTWMNNDGIGHSVTADDGSFDSSPSCGTLGGRCLQRGETFAQTFNKPGRFPYYCRIHGAKGGQGMTGTVTVNG